MPDLPTLLELFHPDTRHVLFAGVRWPTADPHVGR